MGAFFIVPTVFAVAEEHEIAIAVRQVDVFIDEAAKDSVHNFRLPPPIPGNFREEKLLNGIGRDSRKLVADGVAGLVACTANMPGVRGFFSGKEF